MSFRISLYRVPKEIIHKYENFTEDDYHVDKDGIMFNELEKECIYYDTLTDIIINDNEDKFSTHLFKNKLAIEDDMYFGTISKEQFLNIIEEVRVNHILKWFNGRRVDHRKNKLGDIWLNPSMYLHKDEGWTAEEAMKANQTEWNIKANRWKYERSDNEKRHFLNINIDMDNKWIISGANSYEYLIFDLIHILKIFDWKNDVLICIGG